ncbi:MAG: cysteine synthase A [Planctomycetaceae bacterium]
MRVFKDNLESIGHTPLVQINHLTQKVGGTIFAKIEGRNPAYSVKCRIGAAMIWDAERSGQLRPGIKVIEATSGNTGIALAFACAARGYHLTLTMPDTMSIERRAMLAGFGADLILTPGIEGMKGAVDRAEVIARQPGWFMPRQFDNPANPQVHFETTAHEIWDDTDGQIAAFVAGVGTGGTITGVGRFLKREKHANVYIVAVEPASSPVLSGGSPGRHKIQGIGAGFVPSILDRSVIDEIATVTDEEAIAVARSLMRQEGIAGGISCGAAMAAALRLAARPEFIGKNIVTVLPDASERYLSTALFDDVIQQFKTANAVCKPGMIPIDSYDLGEYS